MFNPSQDSPLHLIAKQIGLGDDNSLNNRFEREALDGQGLEEPVDVTLGDETLDEMCIGIFGISVPKKYRDKLGL